MPVGGDRRELGEGDVDAGVGEMGGNDACKTDESQMTPVATFQSQFQTAMNTLTTALPNAKILVASIPDLYDIWSINKNTTAAQAIWSQPGFLCASMFANSSPPNFKEKAFQCAQRNNLSATNTRRG